MKIFLILLSVAVLTVVIIAGRNVRSMNACIDETIALLKNSCSLKEQDAGSYAEMTVYGIMKFHVHRYDIADLGNLSTMTMNMGLMQMATIVFTPAKKSLPLLSCDYMYILNNRKAYVEFYDLVKEKDRDYRAWLERYEEVILQYADLDNTAASPAWYEQLLSAVAYKTGKPKDDAKLKQLLLDIVKTYTEQAAAFPVLPPEEQAEKLRITKDYSDRLISEGGVSTDFFKKSLGEDITRSFFDHVFFGTANYR